MNTPAKMTEEMRQAFFDANASYQQYREREQQKGRGWKTLPDYVYDAVISAAPTPPKVKLLLITAISTPEKFCQKPVMSTHPAPPSELVKALESAEAGLAAFCDGDDWLGTMPGQALKKVRDTLAKVKL